VALMGRLGLPVLASVGLDDLLSELTAEGVALVLMDLETGGLELCHEVATSGTAPPVILLSGHRTAPADRVAGLLAGADDYLTEPADPDELLARSRRSMRRSSASGRPDPVGGAFKRAPALSARERQVLEFLVEGLTDRQIAERLVISPKTVSTHIQHLLGKLQVHSRAQAVSAVLRPEGERRQ
jgi:two-component system, LuxR family, response regulator FixJ